MKLYLISLSILSLILTSCGKKSNDTEQVEDSTISAAEINTTVEDSTNLTVEPTTANEYDKYYSADGIELRINMSQYNKNAKLLTADDIYLLSYNCGYISANHPDSLIIEKQEQLDCALEQYGLVLPPDGLTDDELWDYNTSIANIAISEPFNKMIAEYPISDYSYVIEYEEVGSDGYNLKVGALFVDEENLFFVHTADSKTPDPESEHIDVMGGFCYMAAVPKDTLMNNHYERWTYPEK